MLFGTTRAQTMTLIILVSITVENILTHWHGTTKLIQAKTVLPNKFKHRMILRTIRETRRLSERLRIVFWRKPKRVKELQKDLGENMCALIKLI